MQLWGSIAKSEILGISMTKNRLEVYGEAAVHRRKFLFFREISVLLLGPLQLIESPEKNLP